MSLDIKTATPALPHADNVPYDGDPFTYETASWGERIATVVATAIAVMAVAMVAVLMGLA
jgi:hypothetical protein